MCRLYMYTKVQVSLLFTQSRAEDCVNHVEICTIVLYLGLCCTLPAVVCGFRRSCSLRFLLALLLYGKKCTSLPKLSLVGLTKDDFPSLFMHISCASSSPSECVSLHVVYIVYLISMHAIGSLTLFICDCEV